MPFHRDFLRLPDFRLAKQNMMILDDQIAESLHAHVSSVSLVSLCVQAAEVGFYTGVVAVSPLPSALLQS